MATISHARARSLLGVGRTASADEIRRAYRRQARHHHPDAGGDPETFHELVAAVDLLLDRRTSPEATASPSTGRRAYPSTTHGPLHPDGSPGAVDTSVLATATSPAIGARWSHAGLAAATLEALAGSGPERLAGTSRRPGSWLNRWSSHLSDDLLSTWEVTGASRRGVPGRDLEVVASFPPGARRHVDRSDLPTGWSTTRRPGRTESTRVVRPAADAEQTAVLVADAVAGACEAIGWPLHDWLRTA